ncbi:choline dehydrogenase [Whalleya microplaca]|nr:choline dehydrogenase [Whalleya microplaca]
MLATALFSLLLGALAAPGSTAPIPANSHGATRSDAYDFIIVGGGTAGTALAARLSLGLPASTVLLIEAGPAALAEPKINIPGLKGTALGTKYDWNFTTVPQQHVAERVFSANRGKVLGGSSALNFMTWDRASAAEYDSWESLGNAGWNWDNMLTAMMKAENFTGINTGSVGVGESGPIKTVINRIIPEHQAFWIPTVKALTGVDHNLGSLGGQPLGVMYQPSNVDPTHYNRSYPPNAYIPIAGSNLELLLETKVAKINLDNNKVATGVTLESGLTIQASKEVIISAGSFQSPALLELSGIGSSDILSTAGVKKVVDLPGVGENLQDHIRIQSSYILKDNYTSFDVLKYDASRAADELAKWNSGEVSLYDYTGSGYTFLNWDQAVGNDSATTLAALAQEAVAGSDSVVEKKKLSFMSSSEVPQVEVIFSDGYTGVKGYPAAGSSQYGINTFSLISVVQHPLSRGSVHITSDADSGKLAIDPNYLSNDYDLQAAVQAIKLCRRIATSEPLASALTSEYEPGFDAVTTDEQWRDYVLNTTLTIYHPTGTCAMLPQADGGVVDSDLKVYGTSHLRVVDASIIPVLISGHIQTAVYGIAEMAADKIITQYSS